MIEVLRKSLRNVPGPRTDIVRYTSRAVSMLDVVVVDELKEVLGR